MEFNILRFEAPAPLDHAAERAIMGASAIVPQFDRVAAAATAILGQVCRDENVATKRVEETIISMFSRGALERVEAGVAVRFEHLAYEIRAQVRAKQWGFKWPRNAATLERETPEPWLPLGAFMPSMQDALRRYLAEGLISSCMRGGELMIAESDYLICHKASCEGPFLPLAAFDQLFVDLLRAEHATELVIRSGVVCVPWNVVNDYSAPGSSPLDWELDPQDVPIHGPV